MVISSKSNVFIFRVIIISYYESQCGTSSPVTIHLYCLHLSVHDFMERNFELVLGYRAVNLIKNY